MAKINIVLYSPEIPQNTGNIMRSCVGFNAKLHLIKPLGFSLEEKQLKRSALDYYEYLDFQVYESYEDFLSKNEGSFFYLTRYGHQTPAKIEFDKCDNNIYLFFGRESTGIPYDILHDNLHSCFRIPTTDKIRSLNLSNCVAIMLFQCADKLGYEGLISHEPDNMKGEFFIDNFHKE